MFFRIGAVLRILLLDIIFLALLIGGLVALWGFRATDVREDVPATVRVYKGQVAIVDPATGKEERGGGVRTLKVGQRLQVEPGGDSFVFFADGSVSRLRAGRKERRSAGDVSQRRVLGTRLVGGITGDVGSCGAEPRGPSSWIAVDRPAV